MSIEKLKTQSEKIIKTHSSKVVTAYLLESTNKTPVDTDINRTCGAPIGVSEEKWPKFNGKKMDHAITLDLSTAPALKSLFPPHAKAIALFVSSLIENEAFSPGNKETELLILTEEDLNKSVSEYSPDEEFESTTFISHEVILPIEVFAEDIYERDENDPVYLLSEKLCEYSMAGGKPIWLQGNEHDGDIILQFDDGLVDMNLGDAGVMYVFNDTSFWQCH